MPTRCATGDRRGSDQRRGDPAPAIGARRGRLTGADRHLQHQQRRAPPGQPPGLAAEAEPDVVCLQELKADQGAFPLKAIEADGLPGGLARPADLERRGDPGARHEPVVTRTALPGDPDESQARYIEAAVNGVLIGCLYLPNGNPLPGPKFDYKLAWFERLNAHAAKPSGQRRAGGAGRRLQCRADRGRHLSQPFVWRKRPAGAAGPRGLPAPAGPRLDRRPARHPSHRAAWTFWSYLRHRWPNDKGLRIDHLLLSPDLADQLVDAGVDRWVRGEDGASDHAPAWIVLDR
jgi:exodeoxyribonuclease-3